MWNWNLKKIFLLFFCVMHYENKTAACATALKLHAADTFESLGLEKKSQVEKVGQPLPISMLHQAITMASGSC